MRAVRQVVDLGTGTGTWFSRMYAPLRTPVCFSVQITGLNAHTLQTQSQSGMLWIMRSVHKGIGMWNRFGVWWWCDLRLVQVALGGYEHQVRWLWFDASSDTRPYATAAHELE